MAKLKLRGKSRTIIDDDVTEESYRRSSIRTSDDISFVNDPYWSRLLEEEERDVIALELGEEIFARCSEICYANYTNRQSIYFTVHCAYLAWKKIINLYFLRHDPGEPEQDNFSLRPDKEPTPNPKDSWCARSITVEHPPKKVCSLISNVSSYEYTTIPESPVFQAMAKARDESEGGDTAESDEVQQPGDSDVSEDIVRGTSQVPPSQRKKIMTLRPRYSTISDGGRPPPPPPPTPSGVFLRSNSLAESTKTKEAQMPIFLSKDFFPSERSEVKYSVVPLETRSKAEKKDSEEELPREGRVRWSENVK